MISVLRDIFMADELPSGDKAVYVFLEISAFCFALASVDALATRHWVASIAYLLVAVVFYLGGIKWPQIRSGATRIVRRRDAATNSQSTLPLDDKPPTLVDLFMKEFPNTLRSSDNEDAITIKWQDGAEIKIKRRVYMDFPAKAKFVRFYIPSATPPSADMLSGAKTLVACLKLCETDAVQQAFEEISKQVAIGMGQGDQMTSIQDLTFSGRVLIYHEDFLSIPQKAEIIKAYQAKNMGVQFMGSDYLGTQVVAWHRQHDAKRARK